MKPPNVSQLVVAVLVLLGGALFFLWNLGSPSAAPARVLEPAVEAGEADPGCLPDLGEARVAPPEKEARTPVASEGSAVDEPGPEAVVAADTRQGRVVLVEDSGVERSDLDGTIEVILWRGRSGSSKELEVTGGAFELELDGADRISVTELSLDGRNAVPDESHSQLSLEEGPIVVRAHWPRELRLSVLDAAAGVHLGGITVARSEGWLMDDMQHPGAVTPSRTVVVDGSSSLSLFPSSREVRSADTTWFVHSPGYAWQPVHLDLSYGGEREVRLEPGGDVEVRIVGERPGGKLCLRFRTEGREDSRPLAEVELRGEAPVEVVGLPVGTFRLTLESGHWFEDPVEYGGIELTVAAGGRSVHDLVIDVPTEVQLARLAGRVVLPAEWGLDAFRLTAELDGTPPAGAEAKRELRRSAMEKLPGTPDTWAFDFGELPLGEYDVQLSNGGWPRVLEYAIRVRLGPGGVLDANIEVPPPGTVVLRLVDPDLGEAAEVDHLFWSPVPAGGGWMRVNVGVQREEGSDHFEFRAPIGTIVLGSFGGDYVSLHEEVEIGPGRNELSYPLRRNCPLVIRFFDGETPVPFTQHWYPRPEHLDGEGELLFAGGREGGFGTALSEPGRYVFELPEIEGFEPVPPHTITVRRGEETEYRVQLVREE